MALNKDTMFFIIQFFKQRTEKPLATALVLRLTVALPEFKLRFHAEPPLWSEDQMLAFEPILLNEPSVLRLPASRPSVKIITKLLLLI